ncbi:phage terminase large subunit family protein [Photobacterium leiognathi]|uniref:phage terminase large subunit family protein n=1 Tax=Photobacterium leiognathi TaxID=553611 RepID=UPI0027384820|nr:terminase gpA endonuclease subunit [Photobacterium leiognathi]
MSISPSQINNLRKAVRAGLRSLYRPPPMTAVEWANENFYLSSESSYQEGRWVTLPFQAAIMNAMGNDEIRTVDLVKSARVGYTKMLLAVEGYLLEHKKRNVLTYQPTDRAAQKFMKKHVETAIRDVPVWRQLAPWLGKKHRDSTLDTKLFTNGKQVWVLGGTAANNYREISADAVIYDELAAFPDDVEKEGSPTFLGDKRIEGAVFPKSIRGSTPKIKGHCQIERAANESPHMLRLFVKCPHCGEEQYLKWGGRDEPLGIKWDKGDPNSAFYLCEHNGCMIQNQSLMDMQETSGVWRCERTAIWTVDGMQWYDESNQPIATPEHVAFQVWTAYSPFTTWAQIVKDFLKAKDDPGKLKTFVNTTLGETWDDEAGEKLDWEMLHARRERYPDAGMPERTVALFGGIDTQDDRYEGYVYGFAPDEEAFFVDRWVLHGDPSSAELKKKVAEKIRQQYTRCDGTIMGVLRWCWDSGGHYTDEVYAMSRQMGVTYVIPTKGASVYGKPIADFPRTPSKKGASKGCFLTPIGTDNAKELIMSRLRIVPDLVLPTPGAIHLPLNDEICGEVELKQLTAERKVIKYTNGRKSYVWDAGKRRNEALDCTVLAYAAMRISVQRFGLDLNKLGAGTRQSVEPVPETVPTPKPPTKPQTPPPPAPANDWINGGGSQSGSGGWL